MPRKPGQRAHNPLGPFSRPPCPPQIDGQPKHFTLRFLSRVPTNGGFMFDVILMFDHQETRHR